MKATPASTLSSRSQRMSRTRNEARSRTFATWIRFSMAGSHGEGGAPEPQREDGVDHVGRVGVAAQAIAPVRPGDGAVLVEEQRAALLVGVAVAPAGAVSVGEGADEVDERARAVRRV